MVAQEQTKNRQEYVKQKLKRVSTIRKQRALGHLSTRNSKRQCELVLHKTHPSIFQLCLHYLKSRRQSYLYGLQSKTAA